VHMFFRERRWKCEFMGENQSVKSNYEFMGEYQIGKSILFNVE
jgi:hypothetical protein